MNIDVKTRKELNLLSKEVFGSTSRWQKLITKGYEEAVTEEVTETVPGANEGDPETTQVVNSPVMLGNNSYKQVVKYQTLDTVKQYMLERKAQLDAIRAQIAKMQQEAQEKRAAEQAVAEQLNAASGSAK